MEFNYLLHGGVVSQFMMKTVDTPASSDIQLYSINGQDLLSNILTFTLNLYPGVTRSFDVIKYGMFGWMPGTNYRPGFVFQGWYKDAALTQAWTNADTISAATTLWAKWNGIYAGGSGTSADPFLIANAQQLSDIRQVAGGNFWFRQAADIDLSAWPTGWVPIGNYANPFVGTYDGSGFVIANLKIADSSTASVGLFGTVTNSVFSRVMLEAVDISATCGGGSSGALVGMATNSSFYQCSSTGLIYSTNSAGGLFGTIGGGPAAFVRQCWSSAIISGSAPVGGLAGNNAGLPGIGFFDSYFAGSINSSSSGNNIGGLVGSGALAGAGSTQFTNCYVAAPLVPSPAASPQALIGVPNAATATASFFDTILASLAVSSYAAGATGSNAMNLQTTFSAWTFPATWMIVDTHTVPWLTWEPLNRNILVSPVALYSAEGDTLPTLTNNGGSGGVSWNATLTGANTLITATQTPALVRNSGKSFSVGNSPSEYITVGGGAHDLGSAFTIAAWIYMNSGSSERVILSSQTASGNTTDGFSFEVNNYYLTFQANSDPNIINCTSTSLSAAPGPWYHVAVTKAANGSVALYLNGRKLSTLYTTVAGFDANRPLFIGAKYNGVGYNNFGGYIDDLRIYTTALTPAQVAALY